MSLLNNFNRQGYQDFLNVEILSFFLVIINLFKTILILGNGKMFGDENCWVG